MSHDDEHDHDFGDEGDDPSFPSLGRAESALIEQDLHDLERFEATFASEGFRGVAIFCHDCVEEHYYPWEMMRENLEVLLETGETPVHEPAFAPDPEEYVPWEYARGYLDALTDAGVFERRELDLCARCGWRIPAEMGHASFCVRCGTPLLRGRLRRALLERGFSEDETDEILAEGGLPG